MEFLDSYVVPSAQTSFAAPAPPPGRTSNQQPAPAPPQRGRQPGAVNASSASASAPAPQPGRTSTQRERQPEAAASWASASASAPVQAPAPAPAAAPSRKRKAPTGPPPPSRPFKRQQYFSPSRTPAEVRRIVKGEEFNLALGLPGRPYNLPKLRRPDPYMPDPMFGPPGVRSAAQNGYDAVKKHFDMAHAKWELSVSKMTSDADEMVKYGHMLRWEAHASHRWVGQIGTQTWGEDGRMKNYDPFISALKKVEEMAEKARELVKQVEGDARRWSMEFAKKRRDWGEEEISVTEETAVTRTLQRPDMAPKRKSAPASSASAPSKKPKKITGPPPRSRPFKRPYRLSKDRPMSWYRGDANRLVPQPIFSGAFIIFNTLPKLKPRPMADEPIAVNGFDATKKHFFAAQAKWERAAEIMQEEGQRMVRYGDMLREEAEASHKWVGQVGKLTWEGHHGRMKSYDAFKEALQKV
ncbi:hypothetical protein N0V85_004873 [Neurospora sp. IMI 360204]|nr:hypothetical protein N0V85_004873 [Neurospora sp. IMI 360204]